MSTQESEAALDAIVQQTWKRARTTREIGAFLARRLAAIDTADDAGFCDIEELGRAGL